MTRSPAVGVVVVPARGAGTAEALHAAQTAPGARGVVLVVEGSTDDLDDAVVLAVADASLPVVVVFTGDAGPGATAVGLAADLRVVGADVVLRVEPLTGGTSATLPHVVGDAAARRLLLAPGPIDAEAALRLGMVHEVGDDPVGVALGLAAAVAAQPAGTGAAVRRALTRPDVAGALVQEARLRAVVARHDG